MGIAASAPTIATSTASRALPVVLGWPGADLIYPRSWISASVSDVADRIVGEARDPEGYRDVAVARFAANEVLGRIVDVLTPPHDGGGAR